MTISRRNFLKGCGLLVGGAAAAVALPQVAGADKICGITEELKKPVHAEAIEKVSRALTQEDVTSLVCDTLQTCREQRLDACIPEMWAAYSLKMLEEDLIVYQRIAPKFEIDNRQQVEDRIHRINMQPVSEDVKS